MYNRAMEKERLLGRQVWCQTCLDKRPPKTKGTEYIIPRREGPYDLYPDESGIDRRECGVCGDCLTSKSKFQQSNAQRLGVNRESLVYKSA